MRWALALAGLLLVACFDDHRSSDDAGPGDAGADAGRDAGEDAGGPRGCPPNPDHLEPHEHYYWCIEDAWDDGLALYLPFFESDLSGGRFEDEGRYYPGRSYPWAGDWSTSEEDPGVRHGPRVLLARDGVPQPAWPPIRGAFTMLAVVAGPDFAIEPGTTPYPDLRFNFEGVDEDECRFMVLLHHPAARRCGSGEWCAIVTRPCGSAEDVPLRPTTTPSGMLYLFLTFAEGRLSIRAGEERLEVEWPGQLLRAPGAGFLVNPGYVVSLAIWERELSSSEMDAIAARDAELVDGY